MAKGTPGDPELMVPSLRVQRNDAWDRIDIMDMPAHLINKLVHLVYRISSQVMTVAPARTPAH